MPKLKTHSKVGVTVALKNLIGIIGSKDCLPHHREGRTVAGGDEFPNDYRNLWLLSNRVYSALQGHAHRVVWRALRNAARILVGAGTPMTTRGKANPSTFFASGGWYGNDTIWRTVDDLNRIVRFWDVAARCLADVPQRRYFCLVDGIVSMEGNGPLRGSPKATGVIMAGDDAAAIDIVATTLMGFDWKEIRMLTGIVMSSSTRYSRVDEEANIDVRSNVEAWRDLRGLASASISHRPPNGWRGHVELRT